MEQILPILNAFGITPATYPSAVLGAMIIALWVSLGSSQSKIKQNLMVVITHLTTGRGKLNPGLMKDMSPLQIQPGGRAVLEKSGFVDMFNVPKNKDRFFSIIDSKKPSTKLEVENHSIYAFLSVMGNDGLLKPINVYLYQNPSVRDTFPTLAGVYIRDQYLSEHLEISE